MSAPTPIEDEGAAASPTSMTSTSSTLVDRPVRTRDFGFLPIPKHRRYEPGTKVHEHFVFTIRMNLLLAAAATISVANLYYIQPMLVQVASDFGVSNDAVSHVPTLAQGGYGIGILFVSPLGDLIRRRQLVILLTLMTCTLTIGCAMAKSVEMLGGFSFVIGVFTVTPQICIPWTADMAPSNIRARSMSITLSGLIFGLVLGRVLAGVFATYTIWRDVYWLAVGMQGALLGVLWYVLPDTPGKDIGLSYFGMLRSMLGFFRKYPTLVQGCIGACFISMVFAGFWTSTTFLLSDAPYLYSPFDIGLFGLLGVIGALLAPMWGRLVDRIVPWSGQFIGACLCLISMVVATAAASISIGGVVIPMVLFDCGAQLYNISNSYRVAGIDPKARARLNGCVLFCMFIGQTAGTAILTKIYNEHGWRPTGGTAVGFIGVPLIALLARGPHEIGWIGWRGGFEFLKREKLTDLSPEAVTEGLRRQRTALGQVQVNDLERGLGQGVEEVPMRDTSGDDKDVIKR